MAAMRILSSSGRLSRSPSMLLSMAAACPCRRRRATRKARVWRRKGRRVLVRKGATVRSKTSSDSFFFSFIRYSRCRAGLVSIGPGPSVCHKIVHYAYWAYRAHWVFGKQFWSANHQKLNEIIPSRSSSSFFSSEKSSLSFSSSSSVQY